MPQSSDTVACEFGFPSIRSYDPSMGEMLRESGVLCPGHVSHLVP